MILSFLGWRGIAGIAVAAVLSIMLVAAKMDARHWHKMSDQNAERAVNYRRQLDAISSERQAQKVITRDRIVIQKQIVREGAVRAKALEDKVPALPANPTCKTPKEVLNADL